MLDRMKQDQIAIQISNNELSDSFKNKSNIMYDEVEKNRKSKEQKLQSKFKLDALMKSIDQE